MESNTKEIHMTDELRREIATTLSNYECWYTYDITSAVEHYEDPDEVHRGITREMVQAVFDRPPRYKLPPKEELKDSNGVYKFQAYAVADAHPNLWMDSKDCVYWNERCVEHYTYDSNEDAHEAAKGLANDCLIMDYLGWDTGTTNLYDLWALSRDDASPEAKAQYEQLLSNAT